MFYGRDRRMSNDVSDVKQAAEDCLMQAVAHWSKRPTQLDFGPNSGPGIDPEDQVKGQSGLVVRWNPTTGERHLDELVWGLLPRWTKNPATAPRPINARAETVADHPMFAGAFLERRGIVPATVYYQRRTKGGSGQTFAISRKDAAEISVSSVPLSLTTIAG
jgi:putative SOS response-associated peptidase YedK